MRGKHSVGILLQQRVGITPADAGKTRYALLDLSHAWDHPRGCGENLSALFLMTACTGSPPRMRGKPDGISKYGDYGRITPADAGKTPHL